MGNDTEQASADLLASEELNRRIIEAMPGGIVHVSIDGSILRANAAALRVLGLSWDELEQRYTQDFEPETILEDGSPCSHDRYPVTQALLTGEPQPPLTIGVRKPDGELSWAVFTAVPVKDPTDDSVTGAVVTFLDITEHKRVAAERADLERSLRHQQKLEAIGILASGVAHEINNPVQGIMNYAALIQRQAADPEAARRFAGEILHESSRVATIVKDLLAFARRDAREHRPASVAHIIEGTRVLLETVTRRDGVRLVFDLAPELPPVRCHEQQIQQVLMNLVTNARDAIQDGARDPSPGIRVRATAIEKGGLPWVRITVEDWGVGIPETIREQIFDPFFTTKAQDRGTGLGLSVSHGIVTEHRGELWVETSEDGPTRFHVDLRAGLGRDSEVNP